MPAFLLLAFVGLCAVPLLNRLGPVLASARHDLTSDPPATLAEPAVV
jgi:hypothetical protein